MKIHDLMQRMNEIEAPREPLMLRMRDAHNSGDTAGFDKASAELETYDARFKDEFSRLETRINQLAKMDAADRSDPGVTLHGELTPEFRNYSLARRIASIVEPSIDAGREREIEQELSRRNGGTAQGIRVPLEYFETRATQTTANSAAIAPSDFRPELFTPALTNSTVMRALGATVLTGLSGNVIIPRETGSPNVGWVNEDEALPSGNATFDNLTLTPHHVGAIAEISRQLIMQASPAADAILRQMLSRNIGLAIDAAAINGSGTGAVPQGILNDSAVPTEAYATDLFTTTANMIAKADLANVSDSRGFLATNGIKATAAKTKDSDGRPLGISTIFHGEPVQFSNQVPSNLNPTANKHGLIYGDWADFIIGVWSQLDILVNPYAETAYSKGNILLRAMATVDFGVRRPASFVKATGVVTA